MNGFIYGGIRCGVVRWEGGQRILGGGDEMGYGRRGGGLGGVEEARVGESGGAG